MPQPQRGRNIKLLGLLILLAIAYSSLIKYHYTLTGKNTLDGILGALLGLYICSQGTANILDMLLFGGNSSSHNASRRSIVLWLAFNVFILFIGWLVIVQGTVRFTAP
jgi:hypothetical protein